MGDATIMCQVLAYFGYLRPLFWYLKPIFLWRGLAEPLAGEVSTATSTLRGELVPAITADKCSRDVASSPLSRQTYSHVPKIIIAALDIWDEAGKSFWNRRMSKMTVSKTAAKT